LSPEQEAIRLECNVCHSIPNVAGPNDFVTRIEISRGLEPESHLNPNWIGIHRDVFDLTCQNCHTTDNPGGDDNSSFCSNTACHGNVYTYAGFDAPGLREILLSQIITEPTPESATDEPLSLTYNDTIGPLLANQCGSCHGEGGLQGLNLTTYTSILSGGTSGPAIVLGDPDASLLIQVQSGDQPHFSQLSPTDLDLVRTWIAEGAPEN
jgi:cytochrome c2